MCAECHSVDADATALRDELGADISPAELWSGTMMANSARDPFWWAMVTAETLTIPSAAAAIEATCTRCHAPMAAVDAAKAGEPAPDLALLRQQGDGPAHARAQLGLDGVSCALCHQIAPEGLGQESSYSGGFVVGDDMQIFAGHEQPFTMPMMMHTGYTPVAAAHTGTSATCASCHTLVTQPMTPEGEALPGLHTEQAPYLEWRNSVFNTERDAPDPAARDCQGCHMPSRSEQGVPITTRIARRPGGGDFPPVEPRAPFHRHALVGGNTLVPAILRDNRARLNPPASDAALEATIERARDLLANETGSVAIAAPTRDGDALEFAVTLTNLGGHKLPTGYPSRRVWLQVTVRDGADELVFRSGGVDGEGRLVDAAGEVLAAELAGGPVLPHAALIDVDDAPQVYEAVMLDEQGTPTFRLLRADGYAKDNRLLPLGWSAGAPDVDRIAPVGVAGDADFTGGADTTRYRVHAPAADGPYTIEVRALHQVISARFAAELFAVASAPGSPIHAFQDMYEGADRAPTLIASDARVVD
ncbi:MAG: hypothetical protein KC468_35300 [Myxococcales bacterium]|nr:hypothetical protein [Myxococcales bacterium]